MTAQYYRFGVEDERRVRADHSHGLAEFKTAPGTELVVEYEEVEMLRAEQCYGRFRVAAVEML